jgi:pyrophosphate--fructose-6-phosphate 1-phosphotransferase
MSSRISTLERARNSYAPRLPSVLSRGLGGIAIRDGEATGAVRDERSIAERFPGTYGRPVLHLTPGNGSGSTQPLRVGVVLSGGQAPGGHNVIVGLSDAICGHHPESVVIGFLGGPRGVVENRHRELKPGELAGYRNTGGFDLIGSGRDKIETVDHLAASRATSEALDLDGLVIVGGDDSNTNAAVLAETFLNHGAKTAVVGVPKTIDGDLQGEHVEISFGFDTATKVYAELVGNIARDAKSAGKYWHFIKLMGRSASHVTLEAALQTHPNVALIAEEVEAGERTLRDVAAGIAGVVRARAEAGRPYGVCLIPEGLIEFVPEVRGLIQELNRTLVERAADLEAIDDPDRQRSLACGALSPANRQVFESLPREIAQQLLFDRDAHGNVQVSKIDTHRLLIGEVSRELERIGFSGRFQVQPHFLGYEGRCSAPTNFDADYTYSLGHLAATLVAFRHSGYICGIRRLASKPDDWQPLGVPLTSMMQVEQRKGRDTPVIGKALVDLDGAAFEEFSRGRGTWEIEDDYVYPGPIQYFGPEDVSWSPPKVLQLQRGQR